MFQHLKFIFLFTISCLTESFATEEGYILPPTVAGIVNDLQIIGPYVDEWTIETCFQEKSLELVFIIDTYYEADNIRNIQKEKEFLINIVETLDLGPTANKLSIVT